MGGAARTASRRGAGVRERPDAFLSFAGTWQGDDFENCLREAVESRSQAGFTQAAEPTR